MSFSVIWALALADFRERRRKSSFIFILAGAVALGYFAIPPADAVYSLINVGDYRGIYNSAYVGAIVAVMGAAWLSLGGFYAVKNAIQRDEATKVGQIIAAAPLSNMSYTVGKFLSNFMVLASMAVLLAAMAIIMQYVRHEVGSIDMAALLLPFLLLTLPALAITAGVALLFETIPFLRAGAGNIVWFFIWLTILNLAAGGIGVADFLGFSILKDSLEHGLVAQHINTQAGMSFGLSTGDKPLPVFLWQGLIYSPAWLWERLLVFLAGVGLAIVSALPFARFDPTREGKKEAEQKNSKPKETATIDLTADSQHSAPVSAKDLTPPVFINSIWIITIGELRILLQGVSKSWRIGAVLLIISAAALPIKNDSLNLLLLVAWIWPVIIWSRLGTQQYEDDVHDLTASSPARYRRLFAQWLAGVVVTAAVGVGALVRLFLLHDWPAVAAWVAGALLIPAAALCIGVITRSPRLFQMLYLLEWYLLVNHTAQVDFMGAVRDSGSLAGPSPVLISVATIALLGTVFAVEEWRHIRR